jgi:hypothetical protein
MGPHFGWLSPIAANYVVAWCRPTPQKQDTWMADSRRDDFPNQFVGDLVPTGQHWVVVPPTSCPDATTTPRPEGRSARSGAAAVITTRSGDATVGSRFTRRSPGKIVGSAIAARSRCTKTSNRAAYTAPIDVPFRSRRRYPDGSGWGGCAGPGMGIGTPGGIPIT